MPLNLDYFYGNEAEQYSFYRIPKALFTDAHYKAVSVEAKVLYGLLLDRMSLSLRNGWLDSDGRVYIYFTQEDAMTLMSCGKDKVTKLFRELDTGGIGLIERKKQGQGKPARIYVKNFILPPEPGQSPPPPPVTTPDQSQTADFAQSRPLDCAALQTADFPLSGPLENRSQDGGISAPNKTDKNKTEWNDTGLSIPPSPPMGGGRRASHPRMEMDAMEDYREQIKENISYDILLKERPYEQDLLDGYVELMVEICCSRRDYIRICGENFPTEVVRSRMLKLDCEHIRYVMDSLRTNTTKIGNIKAYTLAALYNAPVTIGQYYTSLVSHDMAQDFGPG